MLDKYRKFHSIDNVIYNQANYGKHEAVLLKLDCTRANIELNWKPVWNLNHAAEKTAYWYAKFMSDKTAKTEQDLNDYIQNATNKNIIWTI